MKNKARSRRTIVKYQIADLGANPLTSRGKKYIRKEIEKLRYKKNQKALRRKLESQPDLPSIEAPYWAYLESHGYTHEDLYANPDLLEDDLNDSVDGDYETY